MRFNFEGKEHRLEFSREKKEVTTAKGEIILSTNPYTTATIYQVEKGKEWTEIASAEVGCIPGDKFVKEEGRMAALRKLMGLIPYEMRGKVWKAYTNRMEDLKKDATVAEMKSHIGKLQYALSAASKALDTALTQSQEWQERYHKILNEQGE